MLGTSMSPKFSLPITATSSVDGSVTLPVCTGLPRGVGLAVIGPPFAGGPVFLTCRPSMLRRWLDTTSAFLGLQSTIDAPPSTRPFRVRPPLSPSREFIFVVMLAVDPLWWADGGVSDGCAAFGLSPFPAE